MTGVTSSPPAPGASAGTWATQLVGFLNDVKDALNGLIDDNLTGLADTAAARGNLRIPILGSVQCVATGNVNIASPGSTFDGITLATAGSDRLLLTGQTTGSQNGPWIWNGNTSPLTRPGDFPSAGTMRGRLIQVNGGSAANVGLWTLVTTATITVDTTATSWAPVAPLLSSTFLAATMQRSEVNNNTVACTNGELTVLPFTPRATVTISNICVIVGTAFTTTTLARAQVGTYNDATGAFVPIAESTDQHTALIAATAGAEFAFPLAATGRFTGTATTVTLVAGTRYAFAIIGVGSGAGAIRGNGNLTAAMGSLAPACCRKLTGQTDAPIASAATTAGSVSYFLVYGR